MILIRVQVFPGGKTARAVPGIKSKSSGMNCQVRLHLMCPMKVGNLRLPNAGFLAAFECEGGFIRSLG